MDFEWVSLSILFKGLLESKLCFCILNGSDAANGGAGSYRVRFFRILLKWGIGGSVTGVQFVRGRFRLLVMLFLQGMNEEMPFPLFRSYCSVNSMILGRT